MQPSGSGLMFGPRPVGPGNRPVGGWPAGLGVAGTMMSAVFCAG